MTQRLQTLRKIIKISCWALRFRIFRVVYFVRAYRAIERSGLFDAEFYRKSLAIVDPKRMDFLAHYLARGATDGKDPHALFDTRFYLEKNPEVIRFGQNPLLHFVERGAPNGLSPHPLFDTAYYLKQYPDVSEAGINPLAHYMAHGARDGRNPSPLFDTAYYLMKNPEIAESDINPLVHYLQQGAWDKRNPHPLFQSDYYLRKNVDVAAAGMNPLVHFVEFGARDGRNPNPFFDTAYYLTDNKDVAASGVNPLSHYIEEGWQRGINPGPFFDMDYYASMYPDVLESGINPLVHYLEFGKREGRYPMKPYDFWIQRHRLTAEDKVRIVSQITTLSYKPVFSIIVPVFNVSEHWLRKCLDSVLAQLYPHWELCIADDASTMPHVRQVLEEYASRDSRIRVVFRKDSGHISSCSNTALELVTGEFITLLDHDDELSEDALYENASLLNVHPDADMIYSDEDKINEEGKRFTPFFKPDWSPDTFLSQMYTCHLGVYRTKLIRDIGGFREGFEGSQDYDLVLRFVEKTRNIQHIPKILYHWRTIPGSTALAAESKHYAQKAGLEALRDTLERRGEPGWVEKVPHYPGQFIIHYTLGKNPLPLISIIIPTRDNAACLEACLDSIFAKSTYRHYEILVLDNGSVQNKTKATFAKWQREEPSKIRIIPLNMPFNYSRLNNLGAKSARGDLLLLLNDDVTVITPDWLQEMAGQALRSNVGAVGAHLLYPDETIQHAGIILGIGGVANHSHFRAAVDSPGYFGRLLSVTNYSAVTGACLMVKKDLYLSVGGLDETLAVAYNDVDFCLRLLSKGYFNMTLPQVRLYHIESKSRGKEDDDEKRKRFHRETDAMLKRWGNLIERDPFYNPNLTRDSVDFSIKPEEIDF